MASPRKGFVHLYTPRLTAFEHTPHSTYGASQNIILFIGGLFDGLLTVPYTSKISDALPPTWTLAQVHLSSSYTGWGTASLQKDVKELSKCVSYFRRIKSGKVVLMGHSTGCQDVMEYLTGPGHESRTPIDAGIIQAPVSDREATLMTMDLAAYKSSCEIAEKMIAAGEGNEIVPSKSTNMPCPITAYRWLSLMSPNHDGDDDYFSSDLTDEQLMKSFGSLPPGVPLCILESGSDEYMPQSIDKEALVRRWIEIVKKGKGMVDEGYSGIVKGATHNLAKDQEEVVLGLVGSVLGFLTGLSPQPNL